MAGQDARQLGVAEHQLAAHLLVVQVRRHRGRGRGRYGLGGRVDGLQVGRCEVVVGDRVLRGVAEGVVTDVVEQRGQPVQLLLARVEAHVALVLQGARIRPVTWHTPEAVREAQ